MLSYFSYFINYAPFLYKDRQSNRQAFCDVLLGWNWNFLFPGVVLQTGSFNSQHYELQKSVKEQNRGE